MDNAPLDADDRRPHPAEIPHPLEPTRDALQSLMLAIPAAVLQSEKFLGDWAFMNCAHISGLKPLDCSAILTCRSMKPWTFFSR